MSDAVLKLSAEQVLAEGQLMYSTPDITGQHDDIRVYFVPSTGKRVIIGVKDSQAKYLTIEWVGAAQHASNDFVRRLSAIIRMVEAGGGEG